MHVVQAPGIRLQGPYRMGLAAGILVVPGIFPQPTSIIAKAVRRRRPGTRRVLPLRLCRQAIPCMPLARIEAANERLRILPGHRLHRAVWITRELAGVTI